MFRLVTGFSILFGEFYILFYKRGAKQDSEVGFSTLCHNSIHMYIGFCSCGVIRYTSTPGLTIHPAICCIEIP